MSEQAAQRLASPRATGEHIIIVEDDRELRQYLGEVVADAGYEVTTFATADDAPTWTAVLAAGADGIITDHPTEARDWLAARGPWH